MLPAVPRSSKVPSSFRFSHQSPVCISVVYRACSIPELSHRLYYVFSAHCCSIHSSLPGVHVYSLAPSLHIFRLKLLLSRSCPFVNVVLFSISQRDRCLLTFLGSGSAVRDFARCPSRVPCCYCTGIPRYTRSHFTRFRYNAI